MAVGFAGVFAGVLVFFGRNILQSQLTNSLTDDASLRPAIRAAIGISTELLSEVARAVVFIGTLLVIAAWFAGPARIARIGRETIAPFLRDHVAATYAIALGRGPRSIRPRRSSYSMARKTFLNLLIIAAPVLVIACGGSGKPSYCSSVDNLKSSIQALPKTDVVRNGTNGLASAVDKVQSDAKAVVNNARSDFPNETSALETSVNALTSSAKQLMSTPSAAAIAQVVSNVSGVATAAKNLADATSSKCS